MRADIFEDLKDQIGCEYISDLPFEPQRTTAIRCVSQMNMSQLHQYELCQFNDLAQYIYIYLLEPSFAAMMRSCPFSMSSTRRSGMVTRDNSVSATRPLWA